MRKRVKLKFDVERGWCVDLPTYTMISASLRPLIAGKTTPDGVARNANPADPALATLTVEVDCPDDYADPTTGAISPARIREIYSNHPRWRDPLKPPDV